jgi:hypothetical protein
MVSKSQLFLIFGFLYVSLDPHKKFDVEGELIDTNFLLFECETKLCILGNVS